MKCPFLSPTANIYQGHQATWVRSDMCETVETSEPSETSESKQNETSHFFETSYAGEPIETNERML